MPELQTVALSFVTATPEVCEEPPVQSFIALLESRC